MSPNSTITVGLISDTHGLLRPEALEALRGSDFIVHAGDIGSAQVLTELEQLAPVTAIRGNNDTQVWAASLSECAMLSLASINVWVVHAITDLDQAALAPSVRVVVSGHSHKAGFHRVGDRLFINPGSAGPRRFSLPVTVARLVLKGEKITPEIVELQVSAAHKRR